MRADLKSIVKECDATEIAQMEQELIAEGVPVEQIVDMCDLHASVVREILIDRPIPFLTPGHPVTTFKRENQAIADIAHELRKALAEFWVEPHKPRHRFVHIRIAVRPTKQWG